LLESWNGSRWERLAVPQAPAPPGMYVNQADPALFGISCVSDSACTAVGAQANGNDSAPLAQSDADGNDAFRVAAEAVKPSVDILSCSTALGAVTVPKS
jgi:hypothetical protein